LSQFTRLTDEQTDDTFLIASPRWHFMQRGISEVINNAMAIWYNKIWVTNTTVDDNK